MSKNKQFKAESKRLLDLMIHSIYTHKEIFLRELISNASDAMDKLYYESLINSYKDVNKEQLKVVLEVDNEKRIITISDNGIGMNQEELEENLGTIAKSGSLAFKENLDGDDTKKEDVDIIGQFGVGFYASFMVADQVEVYSKKYNEEKAYLWSSNAIDGYSISKVEKDHCGTSIVLHIKDNTKEENYDEFLDKNMIESLIKKYSDYVRFPIEMSMEVSKEIESDDKDSEPKYETVDEIRVLNSMIPIWKKAKKDIKKEEYNDFYKSKFNDFVDPLKTIHINVEGSVSFHTLLFIPTKAPQNYYSQDYEKGLQLYSRGVFIMDKASDLIPEYFRFVKGLVDSSDLNLNISREILQQDRQLKVIASKIEKKIKSELSAMLTKDREQYETFWKAFGLQLKFGVYNDFGAHKELLQDLLLFYSSKEQKLVTLSEYVSRMQKDQKEIYYISGENYQTMDQLPQVKKVKEKNYEILYLIDNIDEFALQALQNYAEKTFKNISQGDLDLNSADEKKVLEKTQEDNKELLEAIKDALSDKIKEAKVSTRLVDDPVCLASEEGLSFEMEKVLSSMPDSNPYGMKATRILEINAEHPIFKALQGVFKKDKDKVKDYAQVLYDQALLIEGLPIENPMEFSKKICDIMVSASK